MELCQQSSERMVLSCEISRPNAVVRWYRDGLEVEENNNLILEVDGVYRRLIIPETTVKDSAEYVCDTADDSMTFFVNIAGKGNQGMKRVDLPNVLLGQCQTVNPFLTQHFLNAQSLLFVLYAQGRCRVESTKWLGRLSFSSVRFRDQTQRSPGRRTGRKWETPEISPSLRMASCVN